MDEEIRYCRNCGSPRREGAKFCATCGVAFALPVTDDGALRGSVSEEVVVQQDAQDSQNASEPHDSQLRKPVHAPKLFLPMVVIVVVVVGLVAAMAAVSYRGAGEDINPSEGGGNSASAETADPREGSGELSETQRAYAAYLEIAEDYIEQYGEHREAFASTSTGRDYAVGFVLARLLDFDNDGLEEFLVVIGDDGQVEPDSDLSLDAYRMEVWTYRDGRAVLVYEGGPINGETNEIVYYLYEAEDGSTPSALFEGSAGAGFYDMSYLTLSGQRFSVADRILTLFDDSEASLYLNDELADEDMCDSVRKKYARYPYEEKYYKFSVYADSSLGMDVGWDFDRDLFAPTDATLAVLRGESSADGSNGGSVQSEEYQEAAQSRYAAVLDEWRRRIEADKLSENGLDYTWDEPYSTSIKWVSPGKTGDGFVYCYTDIGIEEPALIVADPDDGYKIYGIYQYDEGVDDIGVWLAHFRYWKYLCCDGVFRSCTTAPASKGEDGRTYNRTYSLEYFSHVTERGEAPVPGLDFEETASLQYSDGEDYYFLRDSDGDAYGSGPAEIIESWEAEWPLDSTVQWRRLMGD